MDIAIGPQNDSAFVTSKSQSIVCCCPGFLSYIFQFTRYRARCSYVCIYITMASYSYVCEVTIPTHIATVMCIQINTSKLVNT